ncbi:hypothetical protein EHQ53_08850 [Leptospira langatensis]|uniref:Cytochrome C n=1 Tax=Leptospira langatensis TaxID=2484983 RepID=A0A5F1ZVI8_9LEPT|nr:hypothetical protein [Leptospira langatensis]TGK01265.1 hypothetical protein EHO57_10020 [Leptospira langatensis]TGL42282.1 hypothetical protein EHQ53_08850 [Leptospira langatensis]
MNRALGYILTSLVLLTSFGVSFAQTATTETTLHDFMEDYTDPIAKKAKKGDKAAQAALERILKEVPNYALDDQKARWKEIGETAIAKGDLQSSCKSCHKEYKREYKKSYRKRPIQVSNELISFLKGSK